MNAAADSVERTLAAAQIPAARLGWARTARLDESTRRFYDSILRSFARGDTPDAAALATEAARLGLELDATLAYLAEEDLVHTDGAGAISVAYPFSGSPTAHRVRLDQQSVYAMCAIDALGMAAMFGAPVSMDSRDPLTGDAIRVQLDPDGQAVWSPEEAVVVTGSCCAGAAYDGCCQVLNFFATPTNAARYLANRSDISGHVISIPEAIEAGRAVFGDVFAKSR